MKVAIMGSAPSSVALAPFHDPTWKIWGCSPGLYSQVPRIDAWFELHRWEPPVIGRPANQKPWFSPEYVAWMSLLPCPVWMAAVVKELPTSQAWPTQRLIERFGSYFMTSSIAWMMALAIEGILAERDQFPANGQPLEKSAIGLYGVDMSATEEYGYQRAGCQYFCQIANNLDINIIVPPESDLLRPMPLYGICESTDYWIKQTERSRELATRLAMHTQQAEQHQRQIHFLNGAIDDQKYQMQTWHPHESIATHVDLWAASPHIKKPTTE